MRSPTTNFPRGMTVLTPVVMLLTATLAIALSCASALTLLQHTQRYQIHYERQSHSAGKKLNDIVARLRTTEDTSRLADETGSEILQSTHITDAGVPLESYAVSLRYGDADSLVVSQQAVRYPILLRRPPAALISSTPLPAGLTVQVYADGVPAVWSAHKIAGIRLSRCDSDALHSCLPDTITSPATFPEDMIDWLFGQPAPVLSAAMFPTISLITGCDSADTDSVPVLWIEAHCRLSPGQTLGSASAPVLLIIQNGRLTLPEGSKIVGMVLMLQRDSARRYTVIMADTASLTGTLVSLTQLDASSRLNLIYRPDVLSRLQQTPALRAITLIPGSWHDFD
ncbi:hypothetical protein [Alteromonas sp. CYL-A6]|uniref:hypothetical protein n=1 Tax=Alteromonas nitratireducens TaxID=3390813 RepID=UPI0034B8B1BE